MHLRSLRHHCHLLQLLTQLLVLHVDVDVEEDVVVRHEDMQQGVAEGRQKLARHRMYNLTYFNCFYLNVVCGWSCFIVYSVL
jgi:hypothetical protein